MAAEPHRSTQPQVNGQNGGGGNSNRATVDGEREQRQQDSQQAPQYPVGPPPHFTWPRQQRPQDPRGLNPHTGARPPPHQGPRRVSPWAVLRTKLPEQQGLRPPGLEHAIYRMQNPEDMMRPRASPDLNGYSRPPMMSRPPSGQLSKPPSLEGPNPPGPTPPRSPFLQRADSRTGSPMFQMGGPGMGTPPPGGMMTPRPPSMSPRPPSMNRLSREEDDDDALSSGSLSRPGSAAPRPGFPNPSLVRTPSGGVGTMPSRPPSRTPPPPGQPGLPTPPPGSATPPRTPQPGRQPSINSNYPDQPPTSPRPDTLDTDSGKSSTPSPRPLSAATSQESDAPPPSAEVKPKIDPAPENKPTEDKDRTTSSQPEVKVTPSEPPKATPPSEPLKGDETPKRPNRLETSKKDGPEVLRDTPSDSKDAPSTSDESKVRKTLETVVNGSHDSPKKLPPKSSAPKKLGTVPNAVKSPSKALPKTPDTPGTADRKNLQSDEYQFTHVRSNLKKSPESPKPNNANTETTYENAVGEGSRITSSKQRVRITEPDEITTKNRPPKSAKLPNNDQRKITEKRNDNLQKNQSSKQSDSNTFNDTLESLDISPGHRQQSHKKYSKKRGLRRLWASFSSFDSTSEKSKLPMNKIQVGAAPSPNLKVVKSKIGSLENANHKPGGGNIKIENRKVEFKAGSRIEAKNDQYTPGGGKKEIQQVKLQWNAKSKIGSLENATHKPGGGDKKIESMKLAFKDKAKPKVGSKDNLKHVPGGGNVKIEDQKLDIKASSRVGSMDNMKHRPGGGEVKIFDDKEYMKQMMGSQSDVHSASNQRRTSRSSSSSRTRLSGSKSGTRENLTDDLYSPEKPAKPLTKPTDQNSNQLSRANPEPDKTEPKPTNGLDKPTNGTDKMPPPIKKPPQVVDGPSNPIKPDDAVKSSAQLKEDFHSVIEKSQTETSEKELTK